MPAIVTIGEKNGVSGVYTDKTFSTIRFKNADNPLVDESDPLIIPPRDIGFSYEKWLRFRIGDVGPDVAIQNLRFYTDGNHDPESGVMLFVKAASEYSPPSKVESVSGYINADWYTRDWPLELGSGPYSGTNVEIGDHCVMFMAVYSNARQGRVSSNLLTFAYDEV